MNVRRAIWAVALIGLLAVFALAADVAGKWKSESEGRDGQMRVTTFDFKVDGNTLTGTMSGGRGGDTKIEEGKINGDEISFVVTRNFQGNEMKIQYKGKVEGDELKLSMQFGDRPAREMVAKRVKE